MYCIGGRTLSGLFTPESPSRSAAAALCLFATAGVAVAGSDVSPLLLTLQSRTDEWEQVPEFVGLCKITMTHGRSMTAKFCSFFSVSF